MMTYFDLFPVAKRFAQRSPVAVLIPEDISATKQPFDLHESTVKIGTIHSAKRFDFEFEYLIDATGNQVGPPPKGVPVDDADRKYRNLLFVGCTRARERLVILTHQATGLH